jgi:primosomal protein N' (replication factor Y)
MYCEVIVATKLEKPLTYHAEEHVHIGQLVVVSLRNRFVVGVVTGLPLEADFKTKDISELLPFFLPEKSLAFLKWFSEYNLIPVGLALKMMVPFSPEIFTGEHRDKPEAVPSPPLAEITLDPAQQRVAERLLERSHFAVDLLDGVTGSGKTEVYLYLIKQKLQQNPDAQALILLPEIALTSTLIHRFEKYFEFKPLVWHSNTTKAQKFAIWKKIATGHKAVVIGARSALFLPFVHPVTIVVDEEHDPSYKQNEQGFYNARDMAIVRGRIEDISILLVSATPSLETVQNVRLRKFGTEKLASRYAEAVLPSVKIVDMRQEQGRPIVSTPLASAINMALQNREQSLIFVNQRGYTPISLCKNCGYKWRCSICDANLTEHRSPHRFICHHCGGERPVSKACPECKAENTRISLGIGTERALEAIQSQFPSARCITLSSDTISSRSVWQSAVDSIYKNEVDIILGTQILAKGHHFPNLTVVGVIEADHGLGGCDLRANERTYQLLDQVAGRAGREKKHGTVFLQTYAPANPLMVALANHDRDVFYEHELKDREAHAMPPFKSLIAIIVSGNVELEVQQEARHIAKCFSEVVVGAKTLHMDSLSQSEQELAKNIARAQLLGPAPAPLSKLRGRYRYRLLIKADKGSNLQGVVAQCVKQGQVDVDPFEFY